MSPKDKCLFDLYVSGMSFWVRKNQIKIVLGGRKLVPHGSTKQHATTHTHEADQVSPEVPNDLHKRTQGPPKVSPNATLGILQSPPKASQKPQTSPKKPKRSSR